ncbi:MAG: glycosyltransferase [Candidatus Hodarchaeales archaeon]
MNYLYLTIKSFNWKENHCDLSKSNTHLPSVTIQLPVYNECNVIKKTLECVLNINYPLEKLFIQILDDSTDKTSDIIDNLVLNSRKRGKNVDIIRRSERKGYKAGALANGLKKIKSELVAIFDADFRVHPDFLLKTVCFFQNNDNISTVQTRWIHSNQNYSLFTLAMSIGLDGHFLVEKLGRVCSSAFITFNGTGGIWRKTIIDAAGGWSARTLAEDLDLAYRAQLMGYKIQYLSHVTSKQEIPPTLRSWIIQQSRWSQGFSQNFRLHLGSVFRSNYCESKLQALLQLTIYFLPVFIVINTVSGCFLLFFDDYKPEYLALIGFVFLVVYLLGIIAYITAINRAKRPKQHFLLIPVFLWLGSSLVIRMAYGTIKGLFTTGGEFIRTPKFNLDDNFKKNFSRNYIPLDSIFILELVFFSVLLIGVIKSLIMGLHLFSLTSFYLFMAASCFLLIISEIKHAFS